MKRLFKLLPVLAVLAAFGIGGVSTASAGSCTFAVGTPYTVSNYYEEAGIQGWCTGTVTKVRFNHTVSGSTFFNTASNQGEWMNYPNQDQVVYTTFPQPGPNSTLSFVGYTLNCHAFDGWMQTGTYNTKAIFDIQIYNYAQGTWGSEHFIAGPDNGWWC